MPHHHSSQRPIHNHSHNTQSRYPRRQIIGDRAHADRRIELATIQAELTLTLTTLPTKTTLDQITEHIATIINTGTANQRKALIENLVDHVTITAPDRLIPVSRIPQPDHNRPTSGNNPNGRGSRND